MPVLWDSAVNLWLLCVSCVYLLTLRLPWRGTCEMAVEGGGNASRVQACLRCVLVRPRQDVKCLVFSLISAHFKIQPIQR